MHLKSFVIVLWVLDKAGEARICRLRVEQIRAKFAHVAAL
jgi:hypothetical protein